MTARLTLIALVCWAAGAAAMDKTWFDLHGEGAGKATMEGDALLREARQVADPWLEMTMLPGGYFTIGTTGGVAAGGLDDGCGITFGHPYAKTSYPLLAVDGEWRRLDQHVQDRARIAPQARGDSLVIEVVEEGKFGLWFALLGEQGESVRIAYRVANLDSRPHTYGLGLILDPALGKWGDGHLGLETGPFVEHDTLFAAPDVPQLLTLWEKSQGARGMGLDLFFPTPRPERIAAANWVDLYEGRESGPTGALYDLALKADWGEQEMGPGETQEVECFLSLKDPDFGKGAFLRWDLPSFFTLTGNRIFPRELKTYLQIANPGSSRLDNLRLGFTYTPLLQPAAPVDSLSLRPGESVFREVEVESKLVFEDQVARIKVSLEQGGQLLDALERVVYLPATPVSDTGMVVQVDSLVLTYYPEVELVFEAIEAASGLLITDLGAENVFLYENGQRIEEIAVGKDTTGGAHAADVVFVFDVTGSMGDEIAAVRNHIIEFADSLTYRRVDLRLGLITFLDEVENVYPFSNDAQAFRRLVADQFPHGGGDRPENSLAALRAAAQLSYRPTARRIAIWITDADYHESDAVTPLGKGEVIDALLANQVVVHAVGARDFKSSYYDPFTLATGGSYYDIAGNFRDILLEISRLPETGRYRLVYRSPEAGEAVNRIELEIRYAGLGGQAVVEYTPPGRGKLAGRLVCFPNPFNSQLSLIVDRSGYARGEVRVYNALGQRVKRFPLDSAVSGRIVWDTAAEGGIGTGLYLVELILEDGDGRSRRETARLVFLK